MATATMNGNNTQGGRGGSRGRGAKAASDGQGGDAKAKPVHVVRMGFLKAAIWENQIERGSIHNVTVSRTYKVGSEYRESQSLGFDDLLPMAKALNAAHSWINDRRVKAREEYRRREMEDGGDGQGDEGAQAGDQNP